MDGERKYQRVHPSTLGSESIRARAVQFPPFPVTVADGCLLIAHGSRQRVDVYTYPGNDPR